MKIVYSVWKDIDNSAGMLDELDVSILLSG
jgi:hypothetical protein